MWRVEVTLFNFSDSHVLAFVSANWRLGTTCETQVVCGNDSYQTCRPRPWLGFPSSRTLFKIEIGKDQVRLDYGLGLRLEQLEYLTVVEYIIRGTMYFLRPMLIVVYLQEKFRNENVIWITIGGQNREDRVSKPLGSNFQGKPVSPRPYEYSPQLPWVGPKNARSDSAIPETHSNLGHPYACK